MTNNKVLKVLWLNGQINLIKVLRDLNVSHTFVHPTRKVRLNFIQTK